MGKARTHMAKTFLAALTAIACLVARAMPALAETIVFGITSTTALSLPHYIAEDRRLYDAEHLAVETYAVGAAAGVLQQLAGGSLDIAQAATDQTLRAIRRGAPIGIVAAGASSNALCMRDEVITPEAALYPDGIRANLDALVTMGEVAKAPALTGFIDTSFLAEALAPGPAR